MLGAFSVGLRSRANDPIDVELLVSSFELPDVFGQFRRVLAVLVLERCRVIVVPLLERRFVEPMYSFWQSSVLTIAL